ncbi:MAG: glycosyltransferase family 4 protein [Acidimicrobiales bacterium]
MLVGTSGAVLLNGRRFPCGNHGLVAQVDRSSESRRTSAASPRVLLVLDSLGLGGAERSTVTLLPYLRERGFDLEVATLHPRPGYQDQVRESGVALHELSPDGGGVGSLRQLRRLIRQRRPDLVHTSLFNADVWGRTAAKLTGTPSVSTLATERYGESQANAAHIRRSRLRASQVIDVATAHTTTRLHAVSTHVADTMARRLRYPRDRIDVVYRGRPVELVDRNCAEAAALRASLSLAPGPVFLALARHEPAKGLDRLVRAWSLAKEELGDANLLVAGRSGTQTTAIEALTDELGVASSVHFLGHRDDVTDLLAMSTAFVLPSVREGLPGALLEAMAAGTPAVVNALPQVIEVVGENEAIIVDAADPEALSTGLLAAIRDPAEAKRRAVAARRRFAETFTLEQSADGMAAFYDRALDIRSD